MSTNTDHQARIRENRLSLPNPKPPLQYFPSTKRGEKREGGLCNRCAALWRIRFVKASPSPRLHFLPKLIFPSLSLSPIQCAQMVLKSNSSCHTFVTWMQIILSKRLWFNCSFTYKQTWKNIKMAKRRCIKSLHTVLLFPPSFQPWVITRLKERTTRKLSDRKKGEFEILN